jgi:hypothetical protein
LEDGKVKRIVVLAGLVALMLCTSVLAVPSVALNGNLYIYSTDNNTVVSTGIHYANISKLPFTAGAPGALNSAFFNVQNYNKAADFAAGQNNSNFDFYNGNLYLDVMPTGVDNNRPWVYKVDAATGTSTVIFKALTANGGGASPVPTTFGR